MPARPDFKRLARARPAHRTRASPRGYAAKAEGLCGRERVINTAAAGWRKLSDSGKAVEQKPHSANVRPTYQWVRPQPGQRLTSLSRYTA